MIDVFNVTRIPDYLLTILFLLVQGISLTIEQFSSLVTSLPEIDFLLGQAGHSIPHPDYDGFTSGQSNAKATGKEPTEKPKKKHEDTKSSKKNIEATSDEGEGEDEDEEE